MYKSHYMMTYQGYVDYEKAEKDEKYEKQLVFSIKPQFVRM